MNNITQNLNGEASSLGLNGEPSKVTFCDIKVTSHDIKVTSCNTELLPATQSYFPRYKVTSSGVLLF
jgi:hypothetical protein